MAGDTYRDFQSTYRVTEDFLGRDAQEYFGYSGLGSTSTAGGVSYYVNGDVLSFHAGWRQLEKFSTRMFESGRFKVPSDDNEYLKHAKWKMGAIADFYHLFAAAPTIGKPINGFVLHPWR
jgi:hypothetical protein